MTGDMTLAVKIPMHKDLLYKQVAGVEEKRWPKNKRLRLFEGNEAKILLLRSI